MPRAKRHHLVPRVYLRRFADERDRLTVVDVDTGISVVTAVDNIAVEGNFYTVQIALKPSDRLEQRHLSRIEGTVGRALAGLDHGWPPVGIVKEGLSNFLALQLVRGREFRSAQVHAFDQFNKMRFKGMPREELQVRLSEVEGTAPLDQEVEELYEFIQREEYTVSTEQTFHLLGMLDVGADLVAPLSRMRWDLLEVELDEEVEFVTCDEPVVRWAEHEPGKSAYFKMGILKAEEITLPLDRQQMMVVRPQLAGKGRKSFVDGPMAGELNRRSVANAHRYYFSHPEAKLHPYAQQ